MYLSRCDDCGSLFDPADSDPKQEQEFGFAMYCSWCWDERVALEQDADLAALMEMEELCTVIE